MSHVVIMLVNLAVVFSVLAHQSTATSEIVAPYRQEFSCGHLYYRTLYLNKDEDALYVGAMDRLFKIDASNVSRADCLKDSLTLPATNAANCISKGKSPDFDCHNHIRVIQSIGDGSRLYVCGTNAHSPKDQVIYANLSQLPRHEFYPGVGEGVAKCPFDPEDNSTAIWVEDGNPGGHPALYSGTNAEFTKADTVIFRGDIFDEKTNRREYPFKRTLKYDSHMLDKPDFVASYDVGQYVYFFFRETAVEYLNCGKAIYSRVARVCKNDVGGKNILNQNWATYLKARLNCSIPGEFPFFFDEIQDVFKARDDNSLFHAVFTTNHNGLTGSAICSFRLEDIQNTFEGKFKEQATTTSVWLPVPTARVPEPRPGSCVDDTRDLPDTVLNFIRKHPLMHNDVPHDADGPVFYRRDIMFTKIAVDRVITSSKDFGEDHVFHVYYAGTDDGKIFKVSRWVDKGTGKANSQLIDVFDATYPHAVRAIEISKENKAIYVTSDQSVQQITTDLCSLRYDTCSHCVRDPYCGWDAEASLCRPKHFTLIQDPLGLNPNLCANAVKPEKLTANYGSAVYFQCNAMSKEYFQTKPVWFHTNSRGRRHKVNFQSPSSKDKFILTQDGGLVILGASEQDSGTYSCESHNTSSRNILLKSYELTVDAHRCAAPEKTADYQKAYSEWCNKFQKYKSMLKSWEERQNKCAAMTGPEVLARQKSMYNIVV